MIDQAAEREMVVKLEDFRGKRGGGTLQFLWRQSGTTLPPCLSHFVVGLHDRLRASSTAHDTVNQPG